MPTYEGVGLIAHVLGFSFSEIMDFSLDEYQKFLKIAGEILKIKAT
ncbi:hypothetical protein KDD93_09190 [Campylobacter sp. faydin G-24]|uniref:Uncharacterized protein n=1 Tax=Campylobacter anatolicus TaxID=2829105 RepID=A0ABS5HKG0_9BACT|nr:hypothetical protein [Campylobacter anatolicus]MBR8464729.1 hypothetical protein [Campylobacter anatolicus]MBR8466334.1 hypothetical protein [Campylobacter anatolicus]